MRSRNMCVFVLGLLVLLTGCWQMQGPTLYVINVLDEKSYNECHITGSISVPYTQVMQWAATLPDKEVEIVVYCANYACTASEYATQQLLQDGFKNVFAYEAGMHDWHAKGYPEECPVESAYLLQENSPPKEQIVDVPGITTQELYQKMLNHGLFQ
jgi:rhodanese-related sulfurtransferase